MIAEEGNGGPIRLRWRRVFHVVVKAEGPERIAPEWWRRLQAPQEPTRDYYRVEDEYAIKKRVLERLERTDA